jgi:hypothetical protein
MTKEIALSLRSVPVTVMPEKGNCMTSMEPNVLGPLIHQPVNYG